MYPAHTQLVAKCSSPSIGDQRATGCNSFGDKNTKKKSENGEIYTAGKNFTLPPAVTAWTNSTSVQRLPHDASVEASRSNLASGQPAECGKVSPCSCFHLH